MPLLLVLILVLIAFGLLLVGFLTSSVVWAWVSVLVSAAAAVVLVVDTLQRRSAVRAGDEAREPSADGGRAAGHGVRTDAPTAVAAPPGAPDDAATALVQVPGRPVAPRRFDPVDPATEVIPVVRSGGWDPGADAEQTLVMPVVRPSGSPDGPPGAPAAVPPSGGSSSPSVTPDRDETPDPRSVPAGGSTAAAPPDATVVVPSAAAGGGVSAAEATQVVDLAKEPDPPAAEPERGLEPVEGTAGEVDTVAPPVASGSSAAPPDASTGAPVRDGDEDRSAAPPADGGPALFGSSAGSSAGSGPVGGAPDEPPAAEAPSADAPPADAPPAEVSSADAPPVELPPVGAVAAEAPSTPAPGEPVEPPVEEGDAGAAALVARLEDEVLVIDEHPRYHVAGCRTLLAAPSIPLPAREAVELGFSPCGWCTPDRTLASRHAPARS